MSPTDRQLEVLHFINTHRKTEQCNPTMAEIAAHFGWRSLNSAQDHVDLMAKKQILRKRGERHDYIVNFPYSEEI